MSSEAVRTESNFTFQPIQPDNSNTTEGELGLTTPSQSCQSAMERENDTVEVIQPEPTKETIDNGTIKSSTGNRETHPPVLKPGTDTWTETGADELDRQLDREGDTDRARNEEIEEKGKIKEIRERGGETAANFKPITQDVEESRVFPDNEDSFYPKLKLVDLNFFKIHAALRIQVTHSDAMNRVKIQLWLKTKFNTALFAGCNNLLCIEVSIEHIIL